MSNLIMPIILKVFAEGFAPREVEFVIVEQHPTLLNVTLQPSKVGNPINPRWSGVTTGAMLLKTQGDG